MHVKLYDLLATPKYQLLSKLKNMCPCFGILTNLRGESMKILKNIFWTTLLLN